MTKDGLIQLQNSIRDRSIMSSSGSNPTGYRLYFYVKSRELLELYNVYGSTLSVVYEDEFDGINEVREVALTPEGVLSFTYVNTVGFSYDTPSFGFTSATKLAEVVKEFDNYVDGEVGSLLTKDNIDELIVVGCIGDAGVHGPETDFCFIDVSYNPIDGYKNLTYFERYIEDYDTRIEFTEGYDISLITFNEDFLDEDNEEGILTLKIIMESEIIDSWITDVPRLIKVDTKGLSADLVLSFGEDLNDNKLVVAENSIPSNSRLNSVYIDVNVELEPGFIQTEGNQKLIFYVVKENTSAIDFLKNLGYEVKQIESEDIPDYE